ncbi:MAG: hypothetical protein MH252_14565 [Thermosynechococcaceae cyanobacterium MS004]|nr:hypothetical protein [Thermosynechococcaceae cyanobacterium MS004]
MKQASWRNFWVRGLSCGVGSAIALALWQGAFSLDAAAQLDSPIEVANLVYKKLPNLPLENQYIRTATKKQAVESTLVSRLIQYHTQAKGRSPLYRLDWKITLADYLGVNDYLRAEVYPGSLFLRNNPMEGDRRLIQALNVGQRNALIQAIVDGFTGQDSTRAAVPSTPAQTPSTAVPVSAPVRQPTLIPLPTAGSADLLKAKPVKPSKPRPTGDAQFLLPANP